MRRGFRYGDDDISMLTTRQIARWPSRNVHRRYRLPPFSAAVDDAASPRMRRRFPRSILLTTPPFSPLSFVTPPVAVSSVATIAI